MPYRRLKIRGQQHVFFPGKHILLLPYPVIFKGHNFDHKTCLPIFTHVSAIHFKVLSVIFSISLQLFTAHKPVYKNSAWHTRTVLPKAYRQCRL